MKCWFPLLFFFSFLNWKFWWIFWVGCCGVMLCVPSLTLGQHLTPLLTWFIDDRYMLLTFYLLDKMCVSIWCCIGCDWWLRKFLYAISLAESIRQVVWVSGYMNTLMASSCVCELWWLGNLSTQPRRLCRRLRAGYNFLLYIQLNTNVCCVLRRKCLYGMCSLVSMQCTCCGA